MNVVGKVGSLITQGVYSVATPFHPFGGAVDIIVVQQEDGSFRSTPWYVQFGKFQGVLKGAEKVVRINVNGSEANFHMYLNNSGEAYFVREGDSSLGGEDKREGGLEHSLSVDNNQCNVNNDSVENYKLPSTLSDPGVLREEYSSFRSDRLERNDSDACRFYDFQDDESYEGSRDLSSEFGSSQYDDINAVENFVEAQGSNAEMVLVSVDGHILMAPISSSEQTSENVELGTPQFHLGPGESNGFCDGDTAFTVSENAWEPEYLNASETSLGNPYSHGAPCGNDNTDTLENLPRNWNLKDHALQDKGRDGMHQLDVCQNDSIVDFKKASNGLDPQKINLCGSNDFLGNSEAQDEERWGLHELEIGNIDAKFVDEDLELEVAENNRSSANHNLATDSIKSKGQDLSVPTDVEDISPGAKKEDKFKSCLDLTIAAACETYESDDSPSWVQESAKDLANGLPQKVHFSNKVGIEYTPELSHLDVEPVSDIDDLGKRNNESSALAGSLVLSEPEEKLHAAMETIHCKGKSLENDSVCEDEQVNINPSAETSKISPERVASETKSAKCELLEPQSRSSAKQDPLSSMFEISLCRHLLHHGMGLGAAYEVFDAYRISEEEFRSNAVSIIKNENLVIKYGENYLPWDKAAPLVLGKVVFGLDLSIESKDAIPIEQETSPKLGQNDSGSASGRRWRLWSIPFRRVKTLPDSNGNLSEEVFVDSESVSRSLSIELTPTSQTGTPRSEARTKSLHKKIIRTNIPTNEQIASLNLKDGQNDVTFSFSTRVLGLQQVKAHIYLWKWNARIVISDVDGTITRSDVLGQFMPLVGRDWSQSGVARLFSAIKENGYQLLFLSARAIVQAYLTKSFLVNLKQDGKTLPIGPVVISPDGLFPSLFREVIRRAPHEFKIACLEDIKALFPPDNNPFYAGFGNRDTDELTYRKIGIPKGKIFIINPKGEVAINHRIDVRSYTSLHTLVNDMFPPTSMVEQEDYNSWNYWRMPLPDIDD